MSLKKSVLIVCALLSVFAVGSLAADNAALDFTLVNKTGFDIYEIYMSPSTQEDWGDDILTADDLPFLQNGQSCNLSFSPEAESRYWDMKLVDENGDSHVCSKLDLTKVHTLTLASKGGKLYALIK
jgi:hypothetical protein